MRMSRLNYVVISIILCVAILLSALFLFSSTARDEIGAIVSVSSGSFAVRNGKDEPLLINAPIYQSDTLRTNASGRLRVRFNDETTLSLGSNTSVELREYAENGSKSLFNAHILHGVSRIVTGKITDLNQNGFSVTTPESIVGIRGTTLSIRQADDRTVVYLEHTERQVLVNNKNLPSGYKIEVTRSHTGDPEPIGLHDLDDINYAITGVAPPAASDILANQDGSVALALNTIEIDQTPDQMADRRTDGTAGTHKPISAPKTAEVKKNSAFTSRAEGSFETSTPDGGAIRGRVSFEINPKNGEIANALFVGYGFSPNAPHKGAFLANLGEGSGAAKSSGFNIESWKTGKVLVSGTTALNSYAVKIGGADNLNVMQNGASLRINYEIADGAGNLIYSGAIAAKLTNR